MNKILLSLLLSAAPLAGQIYFTNNSYSLLDTYFGGILFTEDTIETIENKIENPGFFRTDKKSIAIGFLNQCGAYYSGTPSCNSNAIDPGDFYAWTEFQPSKGTVGTWIGNISGKDLKNDQYDNQNANGSAAIWFNPAHSEELKGISLHISGGYNRREAYNEDDEYNEYDDSYYYHSSQTSTSTGENCVVNGTALIKINPKVHVNLKLTGSYNITESFSDYQQSYSYPSYNSTYSHSMSNNKNYAGGIAGGIITNKGLRINLRFFLSSETYNKETSYDGSYVYGNGSYTAAIEGSRGKVFKYLRHRLYCGIQGFAGATFPVQASESIPLRNVLSKIGPDNRYIFGIIKTPVTLEINLFNTDIYALARFTPELNAYQNKINSSGKESTEREIELIASQFACGIRGKIGDRLEFSCIPEIKSNVVLGGVELKYYY